MPYSNNSGGPWGGGGKKGGGNNGGDDGGRGPWGGGDDRGRGGGGGKGPGGGGQGPDIDEIMRRGQEQLRVLMGGRGGSGGAGGGGFDGMGRGAVFLIILALLGAWAFLSFYTVRPEQRSVELFLGEFSAIGDPGLNFAPWPLVTKEILEVTRERSVQIGSGGNNGDGLMLTGDENIVDIDFEVVWNISDPSGYLFNLAEPQETIDAVAEAAMREVISRSELAPVLNRDRGIIAEEVQTLVQSTLDSYDSGVQVIRLNFDGADPPREVIDAFRDVQAAEQERDRLKNEADANANRALAEARGESAQLLQEAEAYRAQVINEAQGEASRFIAVFNEYSKAEDVTRKRLYLETMERVLGSVDKIIIDEGATGAGQGVVPYLPLNELRRPAPASGGNDQ
ncbi:FtsH protease activity modulator HflK [Algicella marina]|uniref:Protein HflK n=1 Tax=Algicella marina TaxID=2683284 RepID=A0A6P1SZF1_9RHOB|nr:FtsH protease activity modulator HflK [Algicella marina]QHQ35000.1 FtsH protease activity modulator HflK [Algicella marina]